MRNGLERLKKYTICSKFVHVCLFNSLNYIDTDRYVQIYIYFNSLFSLLEFCKQNSYNTTNALHVSSHIRIDIKLTKRLHKNIIKKIYTTPQTTYKHTNIWFIWQFNSFRKKNDHEINTFFIHFCKHNVKIISWFTTFIKYLSNQHDK